MVYDNKYIYHRVNFKILIFNNKEKRNLEQCYETIFLILSEYTIKNYQILIIEISIEEKLFENIGIQ